MFLSIETVYCHLIPGNTCLQNVWYIYMTNYSVPNSFYLQILSTSFEDVPLLGRENGCFFFTCVVWSTVHHTALKNHRMYILLQQSLNLIFDITTIIMFIYCMSQPNVSYFHKNFYMNTHSQQKRKFPTRRKGRCSSIYE